MITPEIAEFYRTHRGGKGAVFVVTAFHKGEETGTGVFSCIETAQAWAAALPDDADCIFVPYVVDVPEYGNTASS